MIPYGRQSISPEDIDAVTRVLRSDFLTQGPEVPAFEAALAAVCEVPYAVAMNSATSALHVACLALNVGPGDLVWTVPNTFAASANCARLCGAEVDFVDIDPDSWNMSPAELARKLVLAESAGRLPKVIIPVHFGGLSCDMASIHRIAKNYGVRIIEDASHAIGAVYDGGPVGSCQYSDICVFSFHPVKIVTCAEGGAALTRQADLNARMQRLRTHGIVRDQGLMDRTSEGPWFYQQIELGLNYRLTDLQAALGLSQLARLDAFVTQRHQIAERYSYELKGLPLQLPLVEYAGRSALHLYVVLLKGNWASQRARVFSQLRESGIGVNVHYIPVHYHPYYEALGFRRGQFPVSEDYYSRALSLPMYPDLSHEEQAKVIAQMHAILAE